MNARILLVDDNPVNRRILGKLLKGFPYEIDEAGSGIQCLELVQKTEYGLIFMDHLMPEMDGVEALHEIRKLTDNPNQVTAVIALTGNDEDGAREYYLSEGFDDYLPKPVDASRVNEIIKTYLSEGEEQLLWAEEDNDVTFPQVEGVDWELALSRLQDEGLLLDTVKDFLLTAESDLKALIETFVSMGRAEGEEKERLLGAYRIKVHSMKSFLAMFGAMQVSEMAAGLEKAAKEADYTAIKAGTGLFAKAWTNLKNALEQAFPEKETGAGAIAPEMLKQYKEVLAVAMGDLDVDTADNVMEELQKYTYPEQEEKLVKELAIAVRNLDAKLVYSLLEQWK